MTPYDITLRDYWRILRKRKNVVVVTTLLLGIFSSFFAILQSPTPLYKASSSVKIEQSSTLTGLYVEALSWSAADKLETQAIVIRSYPIIEEVARRIDFLDKNLSSEEIRQNSKYLNTVLSLKGMIQTQREGFSNIININVTSNDPKLVQRLANTVAEVYREKNIEENNRRIREAKQFIEQQLKLAKEDLKKCEEKVREFREKNKLISIDSETRVVLDQLTKVELEYGDLKQNIEEITSVLKRLERDKVINKKEIKGIFADRVSPIFARLNSELVDLNLERDALLLKFTENHPEVKKVSIRIDETVLNMIAELSAQKQTLEKRESNLKASIDRLKEKFEALPEKGLILSRLEHDVKVKAEIFSLLESKHQEAMIKEAEKIEEVKIVKPAIEPTTPINPTNVFSTSFIGILIGAILGLVLAFIFETLDTSIGAIEDVEAFLEVPVLGIIPHAAFDDIKDELKKRYPDQNEEALKRKSRMMIHFAPESVLAESYRKLRTNIHFANFENEVKTILLTSSSPLEGKTTTVVNLAVAMAQSGKRVLLVESDLRKPMVSKIFGINKAPGLTDYIMGNQEWQSIVRTSVDFMTGAMGIEEFIQTPGIDNLNIFTSGSIPPNPSELLSSKKMDDFISQARESYDTILFDSTPTLATADAPILASKLDGTIIVYHVGQIARGALRRTKVQLDNTNANVLGVILNKLQTEISPGYMEFSCGSYYAYGGEEKNTPSATNIWDTLNRLFRKLIKKRQD
ncbi:MAG: polysaccharide biosynthesis tyrosine autokinase [Thermodesulfobacteriota bacterium]|nr:polysaccharide biosynthesis tyrosine autokinase [Thermodesulfobacteriota bacterium]